MNDAETPQPGHRIFVLWDEDEGLWHERVFYKAVGHAKFLVGTPDGERNNCGELANTSLAIGREEADHAA